jgi:hypothetical protein
MDAGNLADGWGLRRSDIDTGEATESGAERCHSPGSPWKMLAARRGVPYLC